MIFNRGNMNSIKLVISLMLVGVYIGDAQAWRYTIRNETSGKVAIKLDLIASADMDFFIEPGQALVVTTGIKLLRALEVRGMSDPIAMMKVIHPLQGFKFWHHEFSIRHENYKYVDPAHVDITLQADQGDPQIIIYPGSGDLVVHQR